MDKDPRLSIKIYLVLCQNALMGKSIYKVFIIEDYTTKWVELFALFRAIANECAVTLIEEELLRFGFPRRVISDNRRQFVSTVMQQVCYILDTNQTLILVYNSLSESTGKEE